MCDECERRNNPQPPRPWVSLMQVNPASKRLLVTNIPPTMSDLEVLELALPAAREDKGSLHGWSVVRLPDNPTAARVVLHTD